MPYVGASWEVTEQWTLSAIMPWPALLYAPTRETLYRFGASPSGASRSRRQSSGKVSLDLDSWDLGLSAERRILGNLWVSLGAGVGRLQACRVTEGDRPEPEIDLGSSP